MHEAGNFCMEFTENGDRLHMSPCVKGYDRQTFYMLNKGKVVQYGQLRPQFKENECLDIYGDDSMGYFVHSS